MVFNVFVFFIMVFDICSIFFFSSSLSPVPHLSHICRTFVAHLSHICRTFVAHQFKIQNSKFKILLSEGYPSKNAAKVLIIFINTK